MKRYLYVMTMLIALIAASTTVMISKAEAPTNEESISGKSISINSKVYSAKKSIAASQKVINKNIKRTSIKKPVKKVAYLTFDDGPSPNVTPKILKTLREYNVKATFFMLGKSVKDYPEIAKMVYEEGHYIGNHTLSHGWSVNKSLSKFKPEILATSKIIEKTIGYKPNLFRAPYGKKLTKACREFLKSEGIKVYYWNIDSRDSRSRTIPAKVIYKSTVSSLNGRKEVMILMHDGGGHKQTAYALPLIIKELLKQGYEIRPLTPQTIASPKLDWNN